MPLDEAFYVKLTVTAHKGKKVVADVQMINADKQIMAAVTGAQVTASANLNDLFKRPLVSSVLQVEQHD